MHMVIYMSGSGLNFITSALQQDLNKIVAWCEESKLTINVNKTKYVIFGLKSQTKKIGDHHMTVNATKLDKLNSYKYLGITLGSNLMFNKHIENCKKFATHKVFLLSKIRKHIDMETSLKIFKSMAIPYIEYGDIIFTGVSAQSIPPPPSNYTRVDYGGSQNLPRGSFQTLPRGRFWRFPESTLASQNLPPQGYSLESILHIFC